MLTFKCVKGLGVAKETRSKFIHAKVVNLSGCGTGVIESWICGGSSQFQLAQSHIRERCFQILFIWMFNSTCLVWSLIKVVCTSFCWGYHLDEDFVINFKTLSFPVTHLFTSSLFFSFLLICFTVRYYLGRDFIFNLKASFPYFPLTYLFTSSLFVDFHDQILSFGLGLIINLKKPFHFLWPIFSPVLYCWFSWPWWFRYLCHFIFYIRSMFSKSLVHFNLFLWFHQSFLYVVNDDCVLSFIQAGFMPRDYQEPNSSSMTSEESLWKFRSWPMQS